MMKHSFAEIDSARHEVDRQEALDSIKKEIESLQHEEACPICTQDIDHYYSACATVENFHNNMQVSVILIKSPVLIYCNLFFIILLLGDTT